MISGHYSIKLRTQMGLKNGELILMAANNLLTGSIIVMGKENPFMNGSVRGDNFSFSGELTTAVGKVPFTCDGGVNGDEISANVKTLKGNMLLSGERYKQKETRMSG